MIHTLLITLETWWAHSWCGLRGHKHVRLQHQAGRYFNYRCSACGAEWTERGRYG